MPLVTRACGATINFIERGVGPPVFLLAPGGMRSSIGHWAGQPYDPLTKLVGAHRVIAMDQRCGAGESDGPIPSNWDTYRDDQLAVLDAAGVESGCLLVGSCMSPSFIFSLLQHSPKRFAAAVLMQPIGIAEHTTEPGNRWDGINTAASQHWFGDWAQEIEREGRGSKSALASLYSEMFVRPGADRFCFTAGRSELPHLSHPMLIFAGKDMFHPTAVAREIASLVPNAELVERWRDEHYSNEVDTRIATFLREHSTGSVQPS